jgi:hypothetical protein
MPKLSKFLLYVFMLYLSLITLIFLTAFIGLDDFAKTTIAHFQLLNWCQESTKVAKLSQLAQYIATCIFTFGFCLWCFYLAKNRGAFFERVTYKILIGYCGIALATIIASCFVSEVNNWVIGLYLLNLWVFIKIVCIPLPHEHL